MPNTAPMKPFVEKKNDLKAQNIKQELKNTKTGKCKHHKKKKKKKNFQETEAEKIILQQTLQDKQKEKKKKGQHYKTIYFSGSKGDTAGESAKKNQKKNQEANTTRLAVSATQSEIELPNKYVLRPKIRTC